MNVGGSRNKKPFQNYSEEGQKAAKIVNMAYKKLVVSN